MSLAADLGASPLAHRVADIIKRYAAALELGDDWAAAAAVRILVEVDLHKEREPTENRLPATRPRTTDTVEIAVNSFLTVPTDPGVVPS